MPDRLRRLFTGRAAVVAVCVVAGWVLLGFFAVPALLRWQIEKQVPALLDHRVTIDTLRFNPILLRLQADGVALADPQGRTLFAADRLVADFELRSAIDRAWTFSEVSVARPKLAIEVDAGGAHNFQPLLDRVRALQREPGPDAAPTRFSVQRLSVEGARIEYRDAVLAEPLVASIDPLDVAVENLSTLPSRLGRYRVSARGGAGETLESSGELGLNPLASSGSTTIDGVGVATLARGLSRLVSLDAPSGRIGMSASHSVAQGVDGAPSAKVEAIELRVADLALRAPGAPAPLLALQALTLEGGQADLGARTIAAGRIVARSGSVAATIDANGRLDWASLAAAGARSAAASPAAASPAAASPAAAPPLSAGPAAAAAVPEPWRLTIGRVELAQLAVSVVDLARDARLGVDALSLAFSPGVEFGDERLRVELGTPEAKLSGVAARAGVDELGLRSVEATIEKLGLTRAATAIEASAGGARLSLGGAVLANAAGRRVALESVSVDAASVAYARPAQPARADTGGPAASPQLRLGDAAVTAGGVLLSPRAGLELLRVGSARIAAGTLQLGLAADGPDLDAAALNGSVSEATVRGPREDGVLLRIASAKAEGGSLRLRDRLLALERASVSDAQLRAWLDADGELNWTKLLAVGEARAPAPAPRAGAAARAQALARPARPRADVQVRATPAAAAPAAREPAPASGRWRVVLQAGSLERASVGFEDRRSRPALALGVDALRARVSALDTGGSTSARVELGARLRSGGRVDAAGTVRPDTVAADLGVGVTGVGLTVLQPLLERYVDLRLTRGTASAKGRLRYAGPGGTGPLLAYEGGFAIRRLQLEETDPKRTFLEWDEVSSQDVAFTLAPDRLEVGELRADGLVGRVVIAEDRSVNLTDVLVPKAHEADAQAPAAGAAPAAGLFPVEIGRVRVERATLDFADLSLTPKFGTRMHEMKGVIVGLSTDPARTAKVRLDARVNDYGSARVAGEISVTRPDAFTDIEMTFRNVAMDSLSPYAVRFAGRTVIAGSLSLDLQYRIKERQLLGENRIVIDRIRLGERVESPGALDLPLDLAIAILKDSKGVIDIGLPVSGDLNDPHFGYGAIIAKAIGNLIVRIVSAPFHALGKLFGAGTEQVDSIAFEAGSAVLAPPEREKLVSVARALAERPGLGVVVAGVQAPELDAPALRSHAVRGAVVAAAGVKLAQGEDPGPVDVSQPRVRQALGSLFERRHGREALEALGQRAAAAAAVAGVSPPRLDGPAGAGTATDAFYRDLLERLIADEPLAEASLAQLAASRAQAVARELSQAGVGAERISIRDPRVDDAQRDGSVTLRLELDAAK